MSDMLSSLWVPPKESQEFISEGLRQASDAAKQLAVAQQSEIWADISKILDEIHNKCLDLYRRGSLSRTDILKQLDDRQALVDRAVNKA